MLKSMRSILTIAAATIALGGLATSALADTQWEKNHPRREQVNNRLAKQNRRVNHEVKQGEITKGQAAKLHREDRAIRREERTMGASAVFFGAARAPAPHGRSEKGVKLVPRS